MSKPKNKTTFTVQFDQGELHEMMELERVPYQGEYFQNHNQNVFKITKVIYLPWNENYPEIRIEGEHA